MISLHFFRYVTSEPMMDAQDRRALVRCGIVLLGVILIFAMLAWPRLAKADIGERESAVAAPTIQVVRSRSELLPHPPGCPRTQYCGCGASVEAFGKSIRSLWPSAAWFRFPVTAPAPQMVAVRRGHVMTLHRHVHGNIWIVIDHNSGGHKSRIHARSITGFSIRNPYAISVAGR